MTRISLAININYITKTLKFCKIKVLFNFSLLNSKPERVNLLKTEITSKPDKNI